MNCQEILSQIRQDRLKRDMDFVGSFEKLSGEKEALAFVQYVQEEDYGEGNTYRLGRNTY